MKRVSKAGAYAGRMERRRNVWEKGEEDQLEPDDASDRTPPYLLTSSSSSHEPLEEVSKSQRDPSAHYNGIFQPVSLPCSSETKNERRTSQLKSPSPSFLLLPAYQALFESRTLTNKPSCISYTPAHPARLPPRPYTFSPCKPPPFCSTTHI